MRTSNFFNFSQTQSQKIIILKVLKNLNWRLQDFENSPKNGNNKLFNSISFKNLEAEVLKIKEPTDTGYYHCGVVL